MDKQTTEHELYQRIIELEQDIEKVQAKLAECRTDEGLAACKVLASILESWHETHAEAIEHYQQRKEVAYAANI